jgi:histidine phosphotransfer protein HptB
MAYDPGAMEAALSAALGDDAALIAELRAAFFDGAATHVATLRGATSLVAWRAAGLRLKGLAASFGATRLIACADSLVAQNEIDPRSLHKIERAIAALHD